MQERARDFQNKSGWRARWRALLSPWEQARLIWHGLRGRVRWGGFLSFGFLSGLRLLPFVAILIIGVVGVEAYRDQMALQDADTILSGIRGNTYGTLTGEGYRQAWALASATPRGKRAFARRAMVDTAPHRALAEHAGPVFRALFGLDAEGTLRTEILERLWAMEIDSPARIRFFAEFAAWIVRSAPARFPDEIPRLALRLVAAMEKTTDSSQLSWLGRALGGLGANLPPDAARAGALRLTAAMIKTKDARAFTAFAEALGMIRVAKDPSAMDSALDLLQAPMAFDEGNDKTLARLLRYYSRLAGTYRDGEAPGFTDTDAFVAWAREHRPDLDLGRQPRNPFRMGRD
uniref:Uncharacterized protein n=1 Tax=Candidatus Kentrum sp. UNK TaxID=2126344 RepID=A0A451ARR5_9GAMM|nr:MAG: hypothetical protein BECKUNK1418G_GA0071005_12612 [Candidatus Kentron sp. UNK]VFK73694.1 MAG: hypothetical protein BECKUNK1418H_GA0071006_12542 [Candidatus Kentron sp. UNK]